MTAFLRGKGTKFVSRIHRRKMHVADTSSGLNESSMAERGVCTSTESFGMEKKLQFVDSAGDCVGDLSDWMNERSDKFVGDDYNVVTILGGQSSGKSLLLNALFGVNFEVMDHLSGPHQTTKGIWLAESMTIPNTIVFDVEGNDSKERGEERMTFENHAALFALAVTDCLILNIWLNNLGNFTASNYSLLKTILQTSLELLQNQAKKSKTVLLFAVRDWCEALMPLSVVQENIVDSYTMLWKQIQKPAHLGDAKVTDVFSIKVVGFYNAILSPVEFAESIETVQKTWNTHFCPKKYSCSVPADGFGSYCSSIWEVIKSQAHLDIPSQREMLATFKCQEIHDCLIEEVREEVAYELEACADMSRREEFFAFTNSLIKKYTENFRKRSHLYEEGVQKKFIDLFVIGILNECATLAEPYFSAIADRIVSQLTEKLDEQFCVDREDLNSQDFYVITLFNGHSSELLANCLSALDMYTQLCIKEFGERSLKIFKLDTLKVSMTASIKREFSRVREHNGIYFMKFLKKQIFQSLDELKAIFTEKILLSNLYFWDHVASHLLKAHTEVSEAHCKAWREVCGYSDRLEINEEFRAICGQEVIVELRHFLKDCVLRLPSIIIQRFVKYFNYDDNDQPRQWHLMSASQLTTIFNTAKANALSVLVLFESLHSEVNHRSSQLLDMTHTSFSAADSSCDKHFLNLLSAPLVNEVSSLNIKSEALKEIQTICDSAQLLQRSQSSSSWKSIPYMFWVLLLILGWNEIKLVLYYVFPLLSIVCVCAVGFAVIASAQGNFTVLEMLKWFGGIYNGTVVIFKKVEDQYNKFVQIPDENHQPTMQSELLKDMKATTSTGQASTDENEETGRSNASLSSATAMPKLYKGAIPEEADMGLRRRDLATQRKAAI